MTGSKQSRATTLVGVLANDATSVPSAAPARLDTKAEKRISNPRGHLSRSACRHVKQGAKKAGDERTRSLLSQQAGFCFLID
jgi:hypothetical protein